MKHLIEEKLNPQEKFYVESIEFKALEKLTNEVKKAAKSVKSQEIVAMERKVYQQLLDLQLHSQQKQEKATKKTKVKVGLKHDCSCEEYKHLCESNDIASSEVYHVISKLSVLIHVRNALRNKNKKLKKELN